MRCISCARDIPSEPIEARFPVCSRLSNAFSKGLGTVYGSLLKHRSRRLSACFIDWHLLTSKQHDSNQAPSCCDGLLKPKFKRFMAAKLPAIPSFIRSVAVAVAALARAAASLAPNLHKQDV